MNQKNGDSWFGGRVREKTEEKYERQLCGQRPESNRSLKGPGTLPLVSAVPITLIGNSNILLNKSRVNSVTKLIK